MPYKFYFFINDEQKFECSLKCVRCSHINESTGQRCKNKVCIGTPICHVHLTTDHNLKIQESTIPNAGKGLFAWDRHADEKDIIFKKDQAIIEYTGDIVTSAELKERYDKYTAPYGLASNFEGLFIDAACDRSIGSLANKPLQSSQSNAKFYYSRTRNEDGTYTNKAKIRATKNIRNGQEILISYGRGYKFNEPVRHLTKYVRK
jgi:hypothetical protein